MPSPAAFPYLAKATIKYKSPHKQDLTFAKGETIRVTGVAPKTDPSEDEDDDDDDDWLTGETLDGSRRGTFPGSFVEPTDEAPSQAAEATIASAISAPSAAGAIAAGLSNDLKSNVVEEPSVPEAEPVPQAAREAAQKGETEEAGFGAPLPPRPPTPDADEEGGKAAPAVEKKESNLTDPSTAGTTTGASKETEVAAIGTVTAGPATLAAKTDSSSADSKLGTIQSKSPPAVATKPVSMSSSFRDRLAAFNKPAESAPPPLPKGKPGGWKRPTPAAGAPSAPSPAPKAALNTAASEAREVPAPSEPSGGSGGFSAADAQSSIKMSLKERMAALQRNEAAATDAAPQLKPKPSVPGKIGADRRNVALQGMGLAPGATVPARKSSIDASGEADDPALEKVGNEDETPLALAETKLEAAQAGTEDAEAPVDKQETQLEADEPTEALTEEEQEAERRAAIAKRMAALGARRMGGAPLPFGAPAPGRTNTDTSVGSAEGSTSEPGISLPTDTPATASGQEAKVDAISRPSEAVDSTVSAASPDADQEPKILAVPRRTAAPRKKKPAPQAAAVAPAARVTGTAAVSAESDADAKEPAEEPVLVTEARGQDTEANPVETAGRAADSHGEEAAAPVTAEAANETETEHASPAHEEVAGEEQTEVDPEIAENQRQLEEYLRGEGFYEDGVATAAQHEAGDITAAANHETAAEQHSGAEDHHAAEELPRQNVTSPKPPSRPPSTRPPIPKTSLPAPPAENDGASVARPLSSASSHEANMSRRGSLIPLVPATSLPTQVEAAVEENEDLEPATAEQGEDAQDIGPVLAAPKPRMAVPTADPEDDALLAAAHTSAPASEAVDQAEPEPEPEAEPVELTEEEEEAQRRAKLARRMAALGGQRIGMFPGMAPPPIMGAPMPARKASMPAAEEPDEEENTSAAESQDTPVALSRGPPRGGMAIPGLTAIPGMNTQEAEGEALDRARSPGTASVDAPVRLASPPPIPSSPPPKPSSPPPRPLPGAPDAAAPPSLPPGRPSSTVPMASLDDVVRSASPANSTLSRRTSFRPPVSAGISAHSQNPSTGGAEYDAADVREMTTSPPPLPSSPPPLPVSPPPRPASRAPPLPEHAGIPPRRQASSASYASAGQQELPQIPTPAADLPTSPVPARTESSLPPIPTPASAAPSSVSVGARQSSRDLDLMPSSRWWRHGLNPLRLPPTVAGRPDAILYADTSSNAEGGVQVHKAGIYMLFEDYSTTTISLSFQDDDSEESHTSLVQRHSFPPAKPSAAELKQWSSSIGASIAKLASDAAKQSQAPVGDGSSRALVQFVLSQVASALPPVGASLGALVLAQAGPTQMENNDEVRPGDVVCCIQADFKGKKGLAPYHATYGTQVEPTVGIVIEVEAKKNKLRCIIQSPANKKAGAKEEASLRMDDLKSGIVKVFRVAPRQGWVQGW